MAASRPSTSPVPTDPTSRGAAAAATVGGKGLEVAVAADPGEGGTVVGGEGAAEAMVVAERVIIAVRLGILPKIVTRVVTVAVPLAITVVRWDILPEIAPREEAVAAEGTVGEAVGMTGLVTIVVRWGTLLGNALARSEAASLPGFASFLFAHPT